MIGSGGAQALREILTDTLNSAVVQGARMTLLSQGKLDDLSLERAFNCMADVGRFNRAHPAHPITFD